MYAIRSYYELKEWLKQKCVGHLLKDPVFIEQVLAKVKKGESPPKALLSVAKQYIDIFSHSTNPSLANET